MSRVGERDLNLVSGGLAFHLRSKVARAQRYTPDMNRVGLLLVLALGLGAGEVRPATRLDARHGEAFLRAAQAPMGGDLEAIRARGFLRVLVVHNRTHFLIDRGRHYGLAYEMLREFEAWLARSAPKGKVKKRPPAVLFIPVHRDEVFTRLQSGRADLAVANLTITPDREALADFSVPLIEDVSEVLVTGPSAAPIGGLEDLSGKQVYVRRSSSFYTHLTHLNRDFTARGLPPIKIVVAEEHLEAEDLLEMLNAGLIQATFIDSHIGGVWTKVFPRIQLHPEVTLATGQRIAWAARKGTPHLLAEVNAFMVKHRVGTSVGNTLFQRYLKHTKWVKQATTPSELRRFQRTVGFFRRYGDRYQFDPLMLAAQGYQESGLDQARRSRVGAIGVMQVMPATGKALKVGDIRIEEANIHAGAKYMRQIVDTWFNEPGIDNLNRTLFAFAAYNAGPNRIQRLREVARNQGLDPNKWFNQVEVVAAQKVGRETLQYVANISKYYVAYKLISEENLDGLNSEAKAP